jgi:large subunit ribosomal protein L9
MAHSEVILTANIPGLGAEADIVKVKGGYARNYLIPQGKAYEVTPAALRKLEHLKAKRAEREAAELNQAEELARKINKLKLNLTLETGETGKAFGSITAQDLVDKLKGELGGIEIPRNKILLERPIKDTGAHEVHIKLHPDVTAKLEVNVSSPQAEQPAQETPGHKEARPEKPTRPRRKKSA